jgi:ABC-type nitrate/sulfonate/bicarbonate transport system substrate-binding protein
MVARRSLLLSGLGALSAAALGMRTGAHAAPVRALQKVNVVIPNESVFVLNYYGGREAGIFSKHGIDLSVDARPFAGFLAGLPSRQSMVGTYSGVDAIKKINEGLDWVILGPALTVVEEVIVRKDSPFKTIADLRGKKFGTFSTGAGSFKCVRAAMIDAFNLDVVKDTKLEQVGGPALTTLLERGQIDAMTNISSLTMAAEAQPDKFRVLFSPNEYWQQKTGYPIMWTAPIVAWRSWVEQDPKRAKNFASATEDSFRWLRSADNLDAAVKKYGDLAAVTKPEDVAEYKKWLGTKNMFLTRWDRKVVDAQWKFLDVCKRGGIITKVPSQDKYALFVGELGA